MELKNYQMTSAKYQSIFHFDWNLDFEIWIF